jgi:hypothetical protein
MFIYYIDNEKLTTDNDNTIPFDNISSPDENTAALENLNSQYKLWCEKDGKDGVGSINWPG